MESQKCGACDYVVQASSRDWDAAYRTGRCPRCSHPLGGYFRNPANNESKAAKSMVAGATGGMSPDALADGGSTMVARAGGGDLPMWLIPWILIALTIATAAAFGFPRSDGPLGGAVLIYAGYFGRVLGASILPAAFIAAIRHQKKRDGRSYKRPVLHWAIATCAILALTAR
jgi:hypothetical protein